MTEQAAKLTVKVKLHAAQPVVLPSKTPPARLSKLKVTLGLLLLILVTGAGYWLGQQWSGRELSSGAAGAALTEQQKPLPADRSVIADQVPTQQRDEPLSTEAQSTTADTTPIAAHAKADDHTAVPASESTVKTVSPESDPSSPQPSRADESVTASQNAVPQQKVPTPSRGLPQGFSRIVLAATMERLEPGAPIDGLVAQQQIQRLYLFTELSGYAGQQLIHRWSYAGQVKTEALLTIEDSPWRTYSENWLLPDQLGSWRVEIIDQQQQVLYQHDFLYQ